MKLFGINLGGEKPVSFSEFRDRVRQAARKAFPNAQFDISEKGFILKIGSRSENCNLQGIYASYQRDTRDCDKIIQNYLSTLESDNPVHSWFETQPLLRPSLRNTEFLTAANLSLNRSDPPDSLPAEEFIGNLQVILVTELKGRIWAVTQNALNTWEVEFSTALKQAYSNMSLVAFPAPTNIYRTHNGTEELGVVYENDHLTATWIVQERFRDYLGQRLQGSYVVAIPNRGRLTAVRADEKQLIITLQQSLRNFQTLPYPLFGQLLHVDMTQTGGQLSIYTSGEVQSQDSAFSGGKLQSLPSLSQAAQGVAQKEIDSKWGLSEPMLENHAGHNHDRRQK